MDTPIFKKKIENKQATYNKVTEERNLNSKNSYFTKNARITCTVQVHATNEV